MTETAAAPLDAVDIELRAHPDRVEIRVDGALRHSFPVPNGATLTVTLTAAPRTVN